MSNVDKDSPVAGRKRLQLPINRIKTIMKSSPDVETIGQEALYVVTKCAELFIQYITKNAYTKSEFKDRLDYKNLASYIENAVHLDFLTELIPHKMTVEQCRELIKQYEEEHSSQELSDSESVEDDAETPGASFNHNNSENK